MMLGIRHSQSVLREKAGCRQYIQDDSICENIFILLFLIWVTINFFFEVQCFLVCWVLGFFLFFFSFSLNKLVVFETLEM